MMTGCLLAAQHGAAGVCHGQDCEGGQAAPQCSAAYLGEARACPCRDGSTGEQRCGRFRKQQDSAATSQYQWTACACGLSNPDIEDAAKYIVNGRFSTAFGATVVLVPSGSNQLACSGTLVGRDKVITAAHCDSGGPYDVLIGPSPSHAVRRYRSSRLVSSPSYNGDPQQGHDAAVLHLAEPVDEVLPVHVCTLSLDSLKSQTLSLVGYGATGGGRHGAGLRRRTDIEVEYVTGQGLVYSFSARGTGACFGDSGGPAYLCRGDSKTDCCLAGITSYGDDQCRQQGVYQRVDTQLAFLAGQGVQKRTTPAACGADDRCDGACENDPDCETLICQHGGCNENSGPPSGTSPDSGYPPPRWQPDGQLPPGPGPGPGSWPGPGPGSHGQPPGAPGGIAPPTHPPSPTPGYYCPPGFVLAELFGALSCVPAHYTWSEENVHTGGGVICGGGYCEFN